jgi:hypothetical protein
VNDTVERPTLSPIAGLAVLKTHVERISVRARGAGHTFSAWALAVETEQGPGSIVRVEPSPDETYWRGDGVFLGWTSERLAAAWAELRAAEPEPDASPDFQQLG